VRHRVLVQHLVVLLVVLELHLVGRGERGQPRALRLAQLVLVRLLAGQPDLLVVLVPLVETSG
jgi:hypothetical protein